MCYNCVMISECDSVHVLCLRAQGLIGNSFILLLMYSKVGYIRSGSKVSKLGISQLANRKYIIGDIHIYIYIYIYTRHRASGTSGVTARSFSTCFSIELF